MMEHAVSHGVRESGKGSENHRWRVVSWSLTVNRAGSQRKRIAVCSWWRWLSISRDDQQIANQANGKVERLI